MTPIQYHTGYPIPDNKNINKKGHRDWKGRNKTVSMDPRGICKTQKLELISEFSKVMR